MSDPVTAPHGRQAVEEALIEASIEVFATRTPDTVTVREIADLAGVNHGLVHQYFGSKQGLVERTIKHLADDLVPAAKDAARASTAIPVLLDHLVEHPAYVRLLTWSLLGEGGTPELGHDFPALKALMSRSSDEPGDRPTRFDPRIAAAIVTSLMFGWVMYRDYIDHAVDLSGLSHHEIHQAMSESILTVLRWYTSPDG